MTQKRTTSWRDASRAKGAALKRGAPPTIFTTANVWTVSVATSLS